MSGIEWNSFLLFKKDYLDEEKKLGIHHSFDGDYFRKLANQQWSSLCNLI